MKTNAEKTRPTTPQDTAAWLVRRILEEITFHHADLHVTPTQVGRSWMIKVQVNRADMPRVIGGGGLHHRALDTIVAAVGVKNAVNMRLHVLEPDVGRPERFEKFEASHNWNAEPVVRLLRDICAAVFITQAEVSARDVADATTNLEVILSGKEPRKIIEPIGKALSALFNAIGKANGRIVMVDVAVEGEAPAPDLGAIMG